MFRAYVPLRAMFPRVVVTRPPVPLLLRPVIRPTFLRYSSMSALASSSSSSSSPSLSSSTSSSDSSKRRSKGGTRMQNRLRFNNFVKDERLQDYTNEELNELDLDPDANESDNEGVKRMRAEEQSTNKFDMNPSKMNAKGLSKHQLHKSAKISEEMAEDDSMMGKGANVNKVFVPSKFIVRKRPHIRDIAMIKAENPGWLYGRVVEHYGHRLLIEQIGNKGYDRHGLFFQQYGRAGLLVGQSPSVSGTPDGNLDSDGDRSSVISKEAASSLSSSGTEEGDFIQPKVTGQRGDRDYGRERVEPIPLPVIKPVPKGRLRLPCLMSRHLDIRIGDYVFFEPPLSRQGDGVVKEVFQRHNELRRAEKTGNGWAEPEALCGNVDHVVVVTSVMPKANLSLIDRYLTSIHWIRARPTLVFNKLDLDDDKQSCFRAVMDEYRAIGYTVIGVSARSGEGIDQLRYVVGQHHTSVLVGPSGVGKSSLLNQLIPGLTLAALPLTAGGLGRHTTTASRLFHLLSGGHVIDTPGCQSFSPEPIPVDAVRDMFIEFAELQTRCKYPRSCMHVKEPDCAVKAAVDGAKPRFVTPLTDEEEREQQNLDKIALMEDLPDDAVDRMGFITDDTVTFDDGIGASDRGDSDESQGGAGYVNPQLQVLHDIHRISSRTFDREMRQGSADVDAQEGTLTLRLVPGLLYRPTREQMATILGEKNPEAADDENGENGGGGGESKGKRLYLLKKLERQKKRAARDLAKARGFGPPPTRANPLLVGPRGRGAVAGTVADHSSRSSADRVMGGAVADGTRVAPADGALRIQSAHSGSSTGPASSQGQGLRHGVSARRYASYLLLLRQMRSYEKSKHGQPQHSLQRTIRLTEERKAITNI